MFRNLMFPHLLPLFFNLILFFVAESGIFNPFRKVSVRMFYLLADINDGSGLAEWWEIRTM
jgi:hypothetical protein